MILLQADLDVIDDWFSHYDISFQIEVIFFWDEIIIESICFYVLYFIALHAILLRPIKFVFDCEFKTLRVKEKSGAIIVHFHSMCFLLYVNRYNIKWLHKCRDKPPVLFLMMKERRLFVSNEKYAYSQRVLNDGLKSRAEIGLISNYLNIKLLFFNASLHPNLLNKLYLFFLNATIPVGCDRTHSAIESQDTVTTQDYVGH